MADFPTDIAGLTEALQSQRQYTLDVYANLPDAFWQPAQFPYLKVVNPPLWELAHMAWFAEFFCLRWRADDIRGLGTPSCLAEADALFDSGTVPHAARWSNAYPSREGCFDFMHRTQDAVLSALQSSNEEERYPFQLALAHETMHGEALVMTLATLGLPLPSVLLTRPPLALTSNNTHDMSFEGGQISLGESARSFRFDNEMPTQLTAVAPFSISSRVVSVNEFAAFQQSKDYDDDRLWSVDGRAWRDGADGSDSTAFEGSTGANEVQASGACPAMHVNYFQAEAWCRWAQRRLPTEVEWEFAATRSAPFAASTGHVWEWSASPFAAYPGFEPGRYRDYSAPWFGDHQVLRGGSFATHARLRYPQYRNFYTPDRRDMFCGFRTCAAAI